MPIVCYNQLSHVQRRNVHQLLHHPQKAHDFSSYHSFEDCQWVYLEADQIYATLGCHMTNELARLTHCAYIDIAALRQLAHHLHKHALRQGATQVNVQVSPPHDLLLTSIWKSLGYRLYAEQFRLIGLSSGRSSSLRLKAVHAQNSDLYLALRNDAVKGSEYLFPHDQSYLEQLIHRKARPYLVYDKQLVIGTLLFQKHGSNIRLLEIICSPALRRKGYGRRILDAFQEKLRRAHIQTFEAYFLSTHQEVLRLYQPEMFCDIQLTAHWHTFQTSHPSFMA